MREMLVTNASEGTLEAVGTDWDKEYRKRAYVFQDMSRRGVMQAKNYESLSSDEERSVTSSEESYNSVDELDLRPRDFEGELIENEAELVNAGHYLTGMIKSKYDMKDGLRYIRAFEQLRMKVPLAKYDRAV